MKIPKKNPEIKKKTLSKQLSPYKSKTIMSLGIMTLLMKVKTLETFVEEK